MRQHRIINYCLNVGNLNGQFIRKLTVKVFCVIFILFFMFLLQQTEDFFTLIYIQYIQLVGADTISGRKGYEM